MKWPFRLTDHGDGLIFDGKALGREVGHAHVADVLAGALAGPHEGCCLHLGLQLVLLGSALCSFHWVFLLRLVGLGPAWPILESVLC